MFKKICASVLTLVFVSVVLVSLGVANEARAQQGWCWEWSANCAPIMNNPSNTNSGDGLPPQGSLGSTNSGRSQPTRTVIVDRFGAVAFNAQTGRYGYSSNAATLGEAMTAAINDCDMAGCKVLGTYQNACGAFTFGAKPNGGGYGVFRGNLNLDIAKKQALNECNKQANNCQVLVAECSIYGQ
jgi:hypothetical protein